MLYFEGDEDELEDEDPVDEDKEDDVILERHSRFKFLQRFIFIVGIVGFIAVFIAPEIVRQASYYLSGPKTPDYFDLLEIHSSSAQFGPGVVHYGFTYQNYYNEELLEGAFSEAADDWAGALGGLLSFEHSGEEERIDLLVVVTDDPTFPGRTYLEFVHKRYRPRVELNVSKIKDPLVLRIVAAHELGHALGIWGHSDDPGDLMYPMPVRVSPTSRDARTLRMIYGID